MSLPARQQRVLETIEHVLQHGEPRLASMFAMFTRLNTNEGFPRTERLDAGPWRPWSRRRGQRRAGGPVAAGRAVLLVPLLAMLVLSTVLLGISAARSACQASYAQHGPGGCSQPFAELPVSLGSQGLNLDPPRKSGDRFAGNR